MTIKPYFNTDNGILYKRNCLEVMPEIEEKSVDLILTDLPYNTTNLSWDKAIDLDQLWLNWKRILKPGAAVILFGSQPFTTDLINSNRGWFRYEIIWEKTMSSLFLSANKLPMKSHENVLVFCEKGTVYNPQMVTGKPYKILSGKTSGKCYQDRKKTITDNTGTRYPKSVWKIKNSNHNSLHPTQKPLELYRKLILTYSNPGDLVLDCTAGSGTIAIAAERTQRPWIAIEQDPDYCDVIVKRIKKEVLSSLDTLFEHEVN